MGTYTADSEWHNFLTSKISASYSTLSALLREYYLPIFRKIGKHLEVAQSAQSLICVCIMYDVQVLHLQMSMYIYICSPIGSK